MPTLLLTKTFGRLTDKTIMKILNRPEAWLSLSSEQQHHIYALLPPLEDPRTGELLEIDPTIHPMDHPEYGEAIRDFTAYIDKQIQNGADKKAWQDEARNATLKRAEGAYDASKEVDREEYWGQKAVPKLITEAVSNEARSLQPSADV